MPYESSVTEIEFCSSLQTETLILYENPNAPRRFVRTMLCFATTA
jgi:hypothetical protein